MALASFNNTNVGVDSAISVTGIANITQASVGSEYGQISRAKNPTGDLAAIAFSKGTYTAEITGYVSGFTVPALGAAVSGGSNNGNMKVMQSQIQASNQDFAKATVTAKGM